MMLQSTDTNKSIPKYTSSAEGPEETINLPENLKSDHLTLGATTYQHAQWPYPPHGAEAPEATKQVIFVGVVMRVCVKFLTLMTLTGIPWMEKLKGRTG